MTLLLYNVLPLQSWALHVRTAIKIRPLEHACMLIVHAGQGSSSIPRLPSSVRLFNKGTTECRSYFANTGAVSICLLCLHVAS